MSNEHNPAGEVKVEVKPHFRGYFSGIAKADRYQQAICSITLDSETDPLTTIRLKGHNNTPLKDPSNSREYYSFGPWDEPVTLKIIIQNSDKASGGWQNSKIIDPFKFHKEAEEDYPLEVYQTTIISEDGNDNDFNDCTLTVVLYRDVRE